MVGDTINVGHGVGDCQLNGAEDRHQAEEAMPRTTPRMPATKPVLTTRPRPVALSNDGEARTLAKDEVEGIVVEARKLACGICELLPASLTRMSRRPSVLPMSAGSTARPTPPRVGA